MAFNCVLTHIGAAFSLWGACVWVDTKNKPQRNRERNARPQTGTTDTAGKFWLNPNTRSRKKIFFRFLVRLRPSWGAFPLLPLVRSFASSFPLSDHAEKLEFPQVKNFSIRVRGNRGKRVKKRKNNIE